MRKIIFCMLMGAAICALIAPAASYAADSSCNYKKPPATAVELVQNIFCLTKNISAIENGFFIDDEKLRELTGGKVFSHAKSSKHGEERGYVAQFPETISPDTTEWSDQVSISFIKSRKPLELYINMRTKAMHLKYADIENIFGDNWVRRSPITNPTTLLHTKPPTTPTDPYGNATIDYRVPIAPALVAIISIDFDYQGIAWLINIEVKEAIHD